MFGLPGEQQAHTLGTLIGARCFLSGLLLSIHVKTVRTRDVDTATYVRRRCSENESTWMSGNGGHRYHDMVSIL